MTQRITHDSTTDDSAATVPSRDYLPCVQYGTAESSRTPKLRTIFEPVPADATTASPVYILTHEEYSHQHDFEKGYEVAGDYNLIATDLQDRCEADDRVLYPVHVESDVYHEEGASTLLGWFNEFVEGRLGVPFSSCSLYFSGNRSIHVHVPRFVSDERQREHLKRCAEEFCEETDAELDCGLYYRKRLFRLPGVEHRKTGLRKVRIGLEWGKDRIFRESDNAQTSAPDSYEEVLREVFTVSPSLTVDSETVDRSPPHNLFDVLDSDETVLSLGPESGDTETPLVEQKECPEKYADVPRWAQYNAKEFSPYALADEGSRSVAVVRVCGEAFARNEVRRGATLIPAYFYGAHGCTGRDFTKEDEHAPLQLSGQDYEKWDYDENARVVVIGGQSRNSRIFEIEESEAKRAGTALTREGGDRQSALQYLDEQGYDTGSRGAANSEKRGSQRRDGQEGRTGDTKAAQLKRTAEQGDVEQQLSHTERGQVACRLLKIDGWDTAWAWFKQQYGSAFDPDLTHQQLASIVDSYSGDYSHVDVPPR